MSSVEKCHRKKKVKLHAILIYLMKSPIVLEGIKENTNIKKSRVSMHQEDLKCHPQFISDTSIYFINSKRASEQN